MGTPIHFIVPGIAAPQGSKRHVGGGRMIESSKKVGPWRERVAAYAAAAMAGRPLFDGPVSLRIIFLFPRPKGHMSKRGGLLPSAPAHHTVKPDIDKLERAVCDALTGIVWRDDSLVCEVTKRKGYAHDAGGAVVVTIDQVPPSAPASAAAGKGA